jgi:hypothetical protein
MALDADWFALRLVEDGGEVLLGVSGGDRRHRTKKSENVHFVQIRQNVHLDIRLKDTDGNG